MSTFSRQVMSSLRICCPNRPRYNPIRDMDCLQSPVLAWWDMDSTPLPPQVTGLQFREMIGKSLRRAGFHGDIFVNGYGDLTNVSLTLIEDLQYYNMRDTVPCTIVHIPHNDQGDKDASFYSILTDMMFSTKSCHPPASYMLISSDERFDRALYRLVYRNYVVLLARASTSPCKLDEIGHRVWSWEDLLAGELPLLSHSDL